MGPGSRDLRRRPVHEFSLYGSAGQRLPREQPCSARSRGILPQALRGLWSRDRRSRLQPYRGARIHPEAISPPSLLRRSKSRSADCDEQFQHDRQHPCCRQPPCADRDPPGRMGIQRLCRERLGSDRRDGQVGLCQRQRRSCQAWHRSRQRHGYVGRTLFQPAGSAGERRPRRSGDHRHRRPQRAPGEIPIRALRPPVH